MPKLSENAREMLTPKLESGEELRSVGYFRTGPFWAMILLSDSFVFAIKYYYLGVTNKRLIIRRPLNFHSSGGIVQNNFLDRRESHLFLDKLAVLIGPQPCPVHRKG